MLMNDILTELEKVAHEFDYSHQVSDFIAKKFKAAEEQQEPDSKDPSHYMDLVPPYESNVASTKKSSEDHPLLFHIRSKTIDERGHGLSNDDNFKDQLYRNLILNIQLMTR